MLESSDIHQSRYKNAGNLIKDCRHFILETFGFLSIYPAVTII